MEKIKFEPLSKEEMEVVLNAPAIISVLAAMDQDGSIDPNGLKHASELAHLRTLTAKPDLQEYYKTVDQDFERKYEWVCDHLPDDPVLRREFLKQQLTELGSILGKLQHRFSDNLTESYKTFARHLFRSRQLFLNYFLYPLFLNETKASF